MMKKFKFLASFLIVLTFATSCSDWLNVLPENDQTSDEYWQTKQEVEAVLGAGYAYLKGSLEQMFIWGEARGNGIEFFNLVNDDVKDANKLRTMDILPSNIWAKWGNLYKVINMANSVIKYGPGVVNRDASFNTNILNSYLAEAYFQRSLAYFYLVRTFKDVPYITSPYATDDTPFDIAKTDGKVILNNCVSDLKKSLVSAKAYFEEADPFNPVRSKGRATKWALHALLADINLWLGNYSDCIESCDAIINSGYVGLLNNRNLWFSIFYPGNSNESIFEIQFNHDLNQKNSFLTWFNTEQRYSISLYSFDNFYKNPLDIRTAIDGDIRALNSSFTMGGKIWKFIGADNDFNNPQPRTSTEDDQNAIVYRMAEIYLMKAEAEIMTNDFTNAKLNIKKIRDRAGALTPIPDFNTQSDGLDYILEERNREFFAEGKNWFDILRIAQRDNYLYKEKLVDQVLLLTDSRYQAIVKAKLSDNNALYLPIHSDEIKYNKLLVQNPYYENIGK